MKNFLRVLFPALLLIGALIGPIFVAQLKAAAPKLAAKAKLRKAESDVRRKYRSV